MVLGAASRQPRRWPVAVKALVTITILVLLFRRVDPRTVIGAWADIRVGWALAALALVVPNLACQYERVRVGLARTHPGAGLVEVLRVLMVGIAMGAVTPGRVGELAGVMILPKGGRRRALGVLTVMRVYGFLATVGLAAVMLGFMPELVGLPSRAARVFACGLAGAIVLLVAVGEVVFRRARIPGTGWLTKRLGNAEDVLAGMKALSSSDRARFGGWSLLLLLVFLSQFVYLMRAFGGDVAWIQGITAGAISTGIVALLPISVGNIGVRESAAILVWQHLGVPAPVAFNAAFALFLVNVVLPGLVGLAWNAFPGSATGPRGSPQ